SLMVRRIQRIFPAVSALVMVACVACGGAGGGMAPARSASPSPGRAVPSPTAARPPAPAFVLLRSTEITTGARMNFQGQGFAPGEQASVTIEDTQGNVEASLEAVVITKDGNLDEVSVIVPGG